MEGDLVKLWPIAHGVPFLEAVGLFPALIVDTRNQLQVAYSRSSQYLFAVTAQLTRYHIPANAREQGTPTSASRNTISGMEYHQITKIKQLRSILVDLCICRVLTMIDRVSLRWAVLSPNVGLMPSIRRLQSCISFAPYRRNSRQSGLAPGHDDSLCSSYSWGRCRCVMPTRHHEGRRHPTVYG